jgi:hypothetical protein
MWEFDFDAWAIAGPGGPFKPSFSLSGAVQDWTLLPVPGL